MRDKFLITTSDVFVQVGEIAFRLPVTEVQFINKSSLFVLLLGFICQARTTANACT
jgi:hypothetical protein